MTETLHRSRQPKGVSTGGQFAAEKRPETDATLSGATGTVMVRDARGMNVAITPGTIDDNAVHLYLNGQCLALATALAEDNEDWGLAVRTYGDEGLVAHAWAVDPNGTLHDIRGAHDQEAIEDELDEDEQIDHYTPMSATLAQEELTDSIGPQDVDLARTFVPAWHIRRDEDTLDAALWQSGRRKRDDLTDEDLAAHVKAVRTAMGEHGDYAPEAVDAAIRALIGVGRQPDRANTPDDHDRLTEGAWTLLRGMDGR